MDWLTEESRFDFPEEQGFLSTAKCHQLWDIHSLLFDEGRGYFSWFIKVIMYLHLMPRSMSEALPLFSHM
jgi:hypothetical protein